jgi:hypothetical protein
MISSTPELRTPAAVAVSVSEESLTITLADGRTVSAPIAWYPRLFHATPAERAEWRLIGDGQGVHWPQLDEDISVQNVLAGQPSGESQRSLQRWLGARTHNTSADSAPQN